MLSPDDPEARHLVTDLVRRVADGTGFPTLTRIGVDNGQPFAVNATVLPVRDVDYGLLLQAFIAVERLAPMSQHVSACALILPERDIAYVKHGTAPMTTLTVGPNPHDDPDTHRVVDAGLTELMQILLDPPTHRPTGRPFPAAPGRTPHMSPHQRPVNGWQPPRPGRDSHGPHR